MTPRYPLYVISKGRWENPLTARTLERMGVGYRIVVEPQERDDYAAVIDPAKILVLPFSNLGQGSIPARNWVWDHSIGEGHERHWIIDDNIRRFDRLNRNAKRPVRDGSFFALMEQFVDRYENVPMAGPNYVFLAKHTDPYLTPLYLNTRIYSCILLTNSTRHRWRGRYNEDTDLSLRFLKDGDCTILFNAFLSNKVATMRMKGGNTDELYRQGPEFDGRLEMARSLQRQHPDVTRIAWKWGRWQHQVDYRPFRANKLRLREGVEVKPGVNEHGLRLVSVSA